MSVEEAGLVHEGACVGARGATGSFRHRRPRRTDVERREHRSRLGGQREETDKRCTPRMQQNRNIGHAARRSTRGSSDRKLRVFRACSTCIYIYIYVYVHMYVHI